MKVFGADPGTRYFGWAVVESDGPNIVAFQCGVIRPRANDKLHHRIGYISHELAEILETMAPVDVLAYETSFVGRFPKAATALGQAQGAMFAALWNRMISVAKYTPSQVKKAATGRGNASKEQVQEQVALLLGNPGMKLKADEADALAVAVAHHRTLGEAAILRREIVGDPYR